MRGLQNRIIDDVSQCHFRFYEPASERLGAALAHSQEPLVQLLRLTKTWPNIPPTLVKSILTSLHHKVAKPFRIR